MIASKSGNGPNFLFGTGAGMGGVIDG